MMSRFSFSTNVRCFFFCTLCGATCAAKTKRSALVEWVFFNVLGLRGKNGAHTWTTRCTEQTRIESTKNAEWITIIDNNNTKSRSSSHLECMKPKPYYSIFDKISMVADWLVQSIRIDETQNGLSSSSSHRELKHRHQRAWTGHRLFIIE